MQGANVNHVSKVDYIFHEKNQYIYKNSTKGDYCVAVVFSSKDEL
jgi:hypothetical protein